MMLYLGDCLGIMPTLDCQVDMVMCDPPYQTTACKWDTIIPLEPMWEQLKRLIKPNGAIVMTASQPFTTTLIACRNLGREFIGIEKDPAYFEIAQGRIEEPKLF
eukprot:GHVR01187761.1.p2 GENE.GHVR01187761.1~~GHVR01187761.1.p2  ORF type:complete len:104 (+),score=12.41 GHVR01187761.1:888-1199(+)